MLLVSMAGCSPAADAQPGGGGPPQAMPVAVVAARLTSVPVLLEAVGRAEGSKEVEVRARVTGLIEQQRYREGDRVKADAPLFVIERAPFEIALAQARAALAQEQARLEQARREAKRLAPLAEQRAISQREFDDATSTLRLVEATRGRGAGAGAAGAAEPVVHASRLADRGPDRTRREVAGQPGQPERRPAHPRHPDRPDLGALLVLREPSSRGCAAARPAR